MNKEEKILRLKNDIDTTFEKLDKELSIDWDKVIPSYLKKHQNLTFNEARKGIISSNNYNTYRKISLTLLEQIDTLLNMRKNKDILKYLINKLNNEVEQIHFLMELCEYNHDGYRCLNNVYCTFLERIDRFERLLPYNYESDVN